MKFNNMKKLWNKIMKLFGFKYLVNLKTNEIHDLSVPHVNCKTDMIRYKKYINEKELTKLLNDGYNGCRFCMKNYDRG